MSEITCPIYETVNCFSNWVSISSKVIVSNLASLIEVRLVDEMPFLLINSTVILEIVGISSAFDKSMLSFIL